MKFGRSYQMTVAGVTSTPTVLNEVVFGLPLTLEFNITHNIFAESNVADFSIYNLSTSKRNEIQFNAFLKKQAYPVTLRAGYISQVASGLSGYPASLPIVFNGFAKIAYTERSGVSLVTRINAFDNGDTASSRPATQFPSGFQIPPNTPFSTMVRSVMSCLLVANIGVGSVTITPSPLPVGVRGRAFTGSVWTALQSLAREASGAKLYIENGVVNMLGQNDTVPGPTLGILNSANGLLGIPRYDGYSTTCSCIFEPALAIGKQIILDSSFAPKQSNGLCKVIAYTHRGTISAVESGDAISEIKLLSAATPLGVNS